MMNCASSDPPQNGWPVHASLPFRMASGAVSRYRRCATGLVTGFSAMRLKLPPLA